MRSEQLVQALVEECRTTPTKVEDLLRAFSDLVAANLERGDQVYVASLGRFGLRPYMERSKKRKRMFVTFFADPELRTRLDLAEPPVKEAEPCPSCKTTNPGMCDTCGSRKKHVAVYRECKSCISSKTWQNRRRRRRRSSEI